MATTRSKPLDEAASLTAAEVIHKRFSALPAYATVGQVREWFAASPHRRMAFLADAGRYEGSITRDDVEGSPDPSPRQHLPAAVIGVTDDLAAFCGTT